MTGDKESINLFFETFLLTFQGIAPETRYPGPILPFFIWLSSYEVGNTIFLAIIIFTIECITFVFWQNLFIKKVGINFSYFFVFLPHTIWFGLIVSSDVFFYFFSSLTIYCIFTDQKPKRFIIFILTTLALLSRPVAIALPIFIIFWIFFKEQNYKEKINWLFAHLIILIFALIYYSPYFLTEQINLSLYSPVDNFIIKLGLSEYDKEYFGLINIIFSILFVFGIHPSESGLIWAFVLRILIGISLLIGFCRIILKRDLIGLYILITILPIIFLFYPSWRYLLPLIPIMFLNFLIFLKEIFVRKKI